MEFTRLLDYEDYYKEHPDVARAKRDPLDHYINNGWREKRKVRSDVNIEQITKDFHSKKIPCSIPAFVNFASKQITGKDLSLVNDNLARAALDSLLKERSSDRLSATTLDMLRRFPPQLHPYSFRKSLSIRPRVTMIVPTMDDAAIYGGIKTALDFFSWLLTMGGRDVDFRLISQNDAKFGAYAQRFVEQEGFEIQASDSDDTRTIIHVASRSTSSITLRSDEVFVTTFWATAFAIQQGLNDVPTETVQICHFLQDYEPNFYPANSAQSMCEQSLLDKRNALFISNSESLAEYVRNVLPLPAPCIHFTPRLNSSLRPATGYDRANILLFYARKNPRNLLELGSIALSIFSHKYPDMAESFQFLGVGDVEGVTVLGGGNSLRCLGKLHLEEYRILLARARVGLSLMMAPHPSYPPLEMAYSGLKVVTNDFSTRKMDGIHPNIVSSTTIDPEKIADLIYQQCKISLEGVHSAGKPFSSFMSGFEGDDDPFAELPSFPEFSKIFGRYFGRRI